MISIILITYIDKPIPVHQGLEEQEQPKQAVIQLAHAAPNPEAMVVVLVDASLAL